MKHIVVTTDFSDAAARAYRVARELAKTTGAKLTLLTVVPGWPVPPEILSQLPNPGQVDQYQKELLHASELGIEKVLASWGDSNVTGAVRVAESSTAHAICEFAKERQADIIVIATHGRGAVGTFVLGSVVQGVLREAHCPVLAVPPNI